DQVGIRGLKWEDKGVALEGSGLVDDDPRLGRRRLRGRVVPRRRRIGRGGDGARLPECQRQYNRHADASGQEPSSLAASWHETILPCVRHVHRRVDWHYIPRTGVKCFNGKDTNQPPGPDATPADIRGGLSILIGAKGRLLDLFAARGPLLH